MANNALAPPVMNAMASFARPLPFVAPVDPMDFSDKYNTPLTEKQMAKYREWLSKLPSNQQNTYDYDMQGAFKAGLEPSKNGHFPDTFKKPNHPTFSTESKYHGVEGNVGGQWTELPGGKWAFMPGVSATRKPIWNPEKLKAYFASAEPDTTLVLSK